MALALDWYFKIDDLHGTADEGRHQTWIEAYTWKHKVRSGGMPARLVRQLQIVLVTGTATAQLHTAMKTGRVFIQAQLHGVLNGAVREGYGYAGLRPVEIMPGGLHRSGRHMEEVTFDYESG